MDYAFNVPINSLSFGNVSIALLREAFKLKHEPSIFPIGGQVDLSSQVSDTNFNTWLQECINKSMKHHKRTYPVIKLWHLNGGLESVSNKQVLFTFHETSSPTPDEINVVSNNHKVVFATQYSKNIFSEYGCNNIENIPLGFDDFNFKKLDKEYFTDGRISFSLCGKFENRKRHAQVIHAWLNKFGNNPKYFLNCALWNHFINPDQQKQIYQQILGGKKWTNIQFLGFMPQNSMYNDFLNSNDIVIGMAGGEGWDLPVFNSIALGKHAVVLNAHAYKDYANDENSILVKPNGKAPCYDNMFFHPNQPWNQGDFFTWDDKEFIVGCEKAIERVKTNKLNVKGLELQTKFKYSETFNKIYELLK